MVSDHYMFLGLFNLEAGSWADWFSGSMSALAVAVALASQSIAEMRKRKDDRQRDVEVGRRIGWKIVTLTNQNEDIRRHIKSGLANRRDSDSLDMKFARVRPLGMPERKPQELNQNETDLLLKSSSANLLMELELCFGRYSSIVYAMIEYKSRHEALYQMMPTPIRNEGMTFTHKLTAAQYSSVWPSALMLESLLDGIIELSDKNAEELKKCLLIYNQEMSSHFGSPLMEFSADSSLAA